MSKWWIHWKPEPQLSWRWLRSWGIGYHQLPLDLILKFNLTPCRAQSGDPLSHKSHFYNAGSHPFISSVSRCPCTWRAEFWQGLAEPSEASIKVNRIEIKATRRELLVINCKKQRKPEIQLSWRWLRGWWQFLWFHVLWSYFRIILEPISAPSELPLSSYNQFSKDMFRNFDPHFRRNHCRKLGSSRG